MKIQLLRDFLTAVNLHNQYVLITNKINKDENTAKNEYINDIISLDSERVQVMFLDGHSEVLSAYTFIHETNKLDYFI